ncbi:potassium voltage-gated channel protein egl-36-like [Dreissena polymorpha]|uniref:Uncharacterized protein n=1 Tax=Dreissena polymorpha TaxID=45954 RepID=A0A9D4RIP5_DREPO|nr:potassium voltage-gated channel protein egl-36-like [Dreissena polymorpha]KAH3867705.1 hypothetical protein DPMN_030838 [Dreissena polymorpha]
MRCKINVSGTLFEFDGKMLENFSQHTLTDLFPPGEFVGNQEEVFVGRSAETFAAILGYYQTGELHMPTTVCPQAFRQELEFWKVPAEDMQTCCSYRYYGFFDEFETHQDFKMASQNEDRKHQSLPVVSGNSKLRNLRGRVWNVIDNRTQTWASKVYLAIVFLMILLCILVTALSTEPSLQRKATKCERLEYLLAIEHKDATIAREYFNLTECSFGNVLDYWEDEDYEELDNEIQNPTRNITLPNLIRRMAVFDILEYFTTAFFTLDLIMRLLTCPNIAQYCTNILTWIDIISLAGFYIHLAITFSLKEHIYNDGWIKAVNYLQVFRILRLFRVVKNVRASRVLKYSLRQNVRDLGLLAIFLLIAVSVSSSLIYFMEPRERIDSIPSAAYWAVITLTTVGYGDVTPVTGAGRVLASILAICGVLLLSITLPMFVNNFLTLYQYTNLDEYIDNKRLASRKMKGAVTAVAVINFLEPKLSGDHDIKMNAFANSTIPGSTSEY